MSDARILVVEDEENVRYVTVAALRLAGYDVTETDRAHEAQSLLSNRDRDYDLAVLDVMLPDFDGFELCKRIREAGSDVPIVFLTARDETDDRLHGLTIGGDDYLTKPFSVAELVVRVRVVLRRAGHPPNATVLAVEDLQLDDEAHVVRRAGVEVSLSPTEYKLLRFLLSNKGRALSRQQILDHVWNYDFQGESSVVETFISSLRKKVDPTGTVITTVRGLGYRLG